ncbi:unnamed protein product [Adineta steineri]|uniref:Uncharacterized protein n=1 Tax=Adineta steineri TaxID=433720 RepID=A0A819ALV2_9BILA|nr:unnamed protein product [Adineta steineri]CAF1385851.1 unnamed protein product [Adineta steineri]CAF1460689.1 unnamed protein product [Adineta steineri]CAF3781957.1 unnamed protein product [Adineta steineri]CAF3877660.1 unnamed protein product [Adineta steineri]
MTSNGANQDKPLELIQKTYHLQTTTSNNIENSSQNRTLPAKVSNPQPSRKTSVHDVQEATRDDLNKIVGEIHEGLARLNGILETMTAAASVRDEFGKARLQLVVKITDFIYKLTSDSGRRSSNGFKGSSTNLTYNPQHLAYCIEHCRNQLVKAQYLFSSLTLSASIGSSTLENIIVKSLSSIDLRQSLLNPQDAQNNEDIIEIKKDISILDEHVHLLNQRYSNQIPGWQTLDDVAGGTTTMATTGAEKLPPGDGGLNVQRLGVTPVAQKLSTTSSTTSIERSSFCARFYQKCQMVCCICTPHYL